MSSARDVRAMISSLEKTMHRLRSSRGADIDVETRKKSREDLYEDIADATALLRTAKRTGIDATRLIGKVDAAQKLLGKEDLVVVDTLSDDGSVDNQRPNSPEPRHPASPPPPPSQSTRIGQMDLVRRRQRQPSEFGSGAERRRSSTPRGGNSASR